MTIWTTSGKHLDSNCDCGIHTMPIDDREEAADPAMIIARTAVLALMNGMMLEPNRELTPPGTEYFVFFSYKLGSDSPAYLWVVHQEGVDVEELFARIRQAGADLATLMEMEDMMK